MTIAVVESDHLFGTDKVNLDNLITILKEYQNVVDVCCKSENE